MLVDANILLYAVDDTCAQHHSSRRWLEQSLNGARRVGLPWLSLTAFVRIATHPRALAAPLTTAEAWAYVEEWLDAPAAWVPQAGPGHREILGRLLRENDLRGNLVTDAVLAALCVEHGLAIVTADSDFARFSQIERINPVTTQGGSV